MRYVSECTVGAITWTGANARWYPIYVKFEPWVPRFFCCYWQSGYSKCFADMLQMVHMD